MLRRGDTTFLVTGTAGYFGSADGRYRIRDPDCRATNVVRLTYTDNLDSLRSSGPVCAALDEMRPKGALHGDLVQFGKDRPSHGWRVATDALMIHRSLGWKPWESLKRRRSGPVRCDLEDRTGWERVRSEESCLEPLEITT